MMYVVEAISISTNDRMEIEVFETVEEAIVRAEELETEDWRIFVIATTGEPDDKGKVVFDI